MFGVVAVGEDVGVDARGQLTQPGQGGCVRVRAALKQRDGAVDRHPRQHLGGDEVAFRTADLPDAPIGAVPVGGDDVGEAEQ